MPDVIVEREGAVCTITLNRPERLNSFTPNLIRELWAALNELQTDYSARVVILRGAGRAFCAGLDIKHAADHPEDRMPNGLSGEAPGASLSAIISLMRRIPQPVIAAVHGPACGGGFALALAADIRLVGETARMNDAFIRLGVSGCELGLSYHLPRMVGLSVAAELMFTGGFIDSERAVQTGLASRRTPDDELMAAARAMAGEMLRATPLALRKTKETLYRALQLGDLDAVVALEEHTQLLCIRSGDFEEAMQAFIEKREPRFGKAAGETR